MDRGKPTKTISAALHDGFWTSFQRRTDLVETIKEDERFYNGEQWDGPNPDNNPRITLNRIQDAIRKLASKICGTPLNLTFTSSGDGVDCTALGRFDDFICAKMGLKAFCFQSVINGENLGTEITYYGFDPDEPYDVGGFYCGGMNVKHISPLEFAVSNPRENDVQKQDWVMTWTDDYVRNLENVIDSDPSFTKRERAERKEALRESVRRTRYADQTNVDADIVNNTLVRVYLRFFRISKEVCYTMETEWCALTKYPQPLSRKVSRTFAAKVQKAYDDWNERHAGVTDPEEDGQLVKDLEFDFADTIVNAPHKKAGRDSFAEYQEKFSLYPFAIYAPKVINNFIFGMSITKSMISIQQAINYAASLQVQHLQNMAFAKVVAKEDALGGQVWSNDPADKLLIDYSRGESFGYKTLEPPNMSNDAYKIPEWLGEAMKDTYGFGEIMSGQISNQDMSGYLYSLALKQANSTLEQEQQLFWQYHVDMARIRLMFYKHYVSERVYTYEMDKPEYEEEESARQAIMAGYANGLTLNGEDGNPIPAEVIRRRFGSKTNPIQVRRFDGRKMWGIDFDVKITAQQGLVESELNTQQWYQQMFGNGQIQQYAQSPEMLSFIAETAPTGIIPEEYRAIMKHYAKRLESNEVVRLRRENAMLQAQLQQAVGGYRQSEALRAEEQKQFGNRIQAANALAKNAQAQLRQAQQSPTQVDEGQVKSNNAKGIRTDPAALMAEPPTI